MFHRFALRFSPLFALALIGAGSAQAQTISAPTTTAQTVAGGGTLTVTSSGAVTVSGSTTAVTMSTGTAAAPTTLNNSGSINQTGTGRAVRANTAGSNLVIQNFAGGSITAAGNDAVAVGSSTVSSSSVALANAGTITGAGGNQAINFGNLTSGTNSVVNSGTITAALADAVRPGVNGTVTNTGTIMSTAANGSGSDGIDAQTNSGVQITNSSSGATATSLIEGGRHGITGGDTTGKAFTMSVTNYANGTIQGDNGSGINIDGISAAEVVTVVNNGTITGNGKTVASGSTSQDGDGVDVDGLVNLTNSGIIKSINAIGDTSEGVTVGGGTITNSAGALIEGDVTAGNMSGAVGRGITIAGVDTSGTAAAIYANTTITNSGTIRGQTDSGINVGEGGPASGFTVKIVNNAGGLIEGGGPVAAIVTGADNDTIINSGTIKADSSGVAIDMGAGTNTLQITGGAASIIGDVSGGANSVNSALTIDPGSGQKFAYAGAFSNFATVGINSGTVTLSGASTYAGPTTVAGNATLVAANTSGGSATGTGTVNVMANATLAGNGTITGPVTLASGGTISPGTAGTIGTLTAGEVDLVGGAHLDFKLGSNATNSDELTISGVFHYSLGTGQVLVDLLNNGGLTTGHYTLASFGSQSGISVGDFSFGTVPSGFNGTFDVTGNTLGLTINAVPEPSTWAMIIVVAVTGGVTARRRKSAMATAND